MTGIYLRRKKILRIKELEQIILMTETVKAYLNFERSPTQTLIDILSEDSSLYRLNFLGRCKELYGENGDFHLSWRKAVNECAGNLTGECTELLISLGEKLGSTDVYGQINMVQMYENLFTVKMEEEKDELSQKGRLYVWTGVCTGIAAALIIW